MITVVPTHPDSGLYTILDWVGDWNGDPGTGWDVAEFLKELQIILS